MGTDASNATHGAGSGLDRRSLIRRAAAVGAAAWTAPVIIGSLASPAGAITGGVAPPVNDGGCRTVSSNTVVTYTVGTGYTFIGERVIVAGSCPASITYTPISGQSVTLSFVKQTFHYVYLVVQSTGGECFLYVYYVHSPNPNGAPCTNNDLVGVATCQTPTITGLGCTPTRVEP